jgi:hypothetical protein
VGFQHGTSFLKQRHAPINDDLAHPALKVHWPNSVNSDNRVIIDIVNSDKDIVNSDNRYC